MNESEKVVLIGLQPAHLSACFYELSQLSEERQPPIDRELVMCPKEFF